MSVHSRIVSKSTELFFNYGVNAISTDNISMELGISKRTFYQHFESKQKLVEIIVINEIEMAWQNLQALKDCDYNPVLEAIKICELELKLSKLRNLSFLRDIKKSYPEVWELYDGFRERYMQTVLIENIRRGKAECYYWTELNDSFTANLWVEMSYLPKDANWESLAARQHFIRGLLNARGISEYLFWQ